jgi:hypothetical protein
VNKQAYLKGFIGQMTKRSNNLSMPGMAPDPQIVKDIGRHDPKALSPAMRADKALSTVQPPIPKPFNAAGAGRIDVNPVRK